VYGYQNEALLRYGIVWMRCIFWRNLNTDSGRT